MGGRPLPQWPGDVPEDPDNERTAMGERRHHNWQPMAENLRPGETLRTPAEGVPMDQLTGRAMRPRPTTLTPADVRDMGFDPQAQPHASTTSEFLWLELVEQRELADLHNHVSSLCRIMDANQQRWAQATYTRQAAEDVSCTLVEINRFLHAIEQEYGRRRVAIPPQFNTRAK